MCFILTKNPVSSRFDPEPRRVVFATTHWSIVLEAGQDYSPKASEAMARLCRTYWYPLYAYLRRKGYSAPDSQDLTQEFFARLLARNYLSTADRNKGKFRSFLLGSLEHFLAREWTRGQALKRGGGNTLFSLNQIDAENLYLLEPTTGLTAERFFDRRWATTLLERAMSRLREECQESQKIELFDRVEGCLSGERGERSYGEIGAALHMSAGAIKVAVHRLRQRYGELVRNEIAQTVATPEEVDDELHYLLAVLRE